MKFEGLVKRKMKINRNESLGIKCGHVEKNLICNDLKICVNSMDYSIMGMSSNSDNNETFRE